MNLPVACRHPEKTGTNRFGPRIRDWSITRDRNTGHPTGIRVLRRWGPYASITSLTWRIYSYVESGSVNGYCESRKLNRTASRELLSPRVSELGSAGPVSPSFFLPSTSPPLLPPHASSIGWAKCMRTPLTVSHHPLALLLPSHHRASWASQRDYSIAGLQFSEMRTASDAHAHNGASYVYVPWVPWVRFRFPVFFLVKGLHCFLLPLFLGELVVSVAGCTFWSN